MYGKTPLAEILPEVKKTGAVGIDLWPLPHGNQREQVDELGHDSFKALLASHGVRLEMVTRFDLGPFKLQDEIRAASRMGAKLIVCGAVGPQNLQGAELKSAVQKFVEQLEPTLAVAAECGMTIGIENHDHNLIDSADSMRYLADLCADRPLGIALAPYHMPQDAAAIAKLISDLGPRLAHFYAWQHGRGSRTKQPRADELLQLPGRGPLDFAPLLAALANSGYLGLTEIFMHPFPRGVPIMDTTAEVTAEINRARESLARAS
jgi:sugar phosphate isomerase/epimerase